jgi:hypothetical protein
MMSNARRRLDSNIVGRVTTPRPLSSGVRSWPAGTVEEGRIFRLALVMVNRMHSTTTIDLDILFPCRSSAEFRRRRRCQEVER